MKLLDYIQGARKGKEAHRLEKEAMRDPFLADSMDGYHNTEGNHKPKIEELHRLVMSKSKGKKNYTVVWGIAASLFIGVFISGYFLFQEDSLTKKGREIALESEQPKLPEERKEEILATVTQEDTLKTTITLIAKNREPKRYDLVPVSDLIELSDTVMKETDLSLEIEPNLIGAVKPIAALSEVRGQVTDHKGEPLAGASVAVKGTTEGTITDLDGRFVLNTSGKEELLVDYIGYDPLTIPADTTANMLIAMNEDTQPLDEVVVTSYSAQKRRSGIVGSVQETKYAGKPKPVMGMKKFKKYLKENRIWPDGEECAHKKGKVILTFLVDEDGRPDSITVKKSLCPLLDEEAIRLIEDGPDWTIGNEAAEITIRF